MPGQSTECRLASGAGKEQQRLLSNNSSSSSSKRLQLTMNQALRYSTSIIHIALFAAYCHVCSEAANV